MTPRCSKDHRYDDALATLPSTQGGTGRHKCAGCAYDKGYDSGYRLIEHVEMNFADLPDSQAGSIRHRSVHAAFALGYLNGTTDKLKGLPNAAGS